MIEILIIIAVVRMFTKVAGEKNLNKTMWGVIGAVSYYLPVLVMGFVVLPAVIESGAISFGSGFGAIIAVVLINILVGVITCFIAFQVLKSQDAQYDPNAPSPFDNNAQRPFDDGSQK